MSGRLARWLLSLAARPGAPGGPTLIIIRHHRVYGPGERPLYRLGVSESVLAGQLAMLRDLGLAPVTVREGLARLDRGAPGRHVALSFDDGYADNVRRALPQLERFGAAASFYLAAGWIEERVTPWWDRLAGIFARAERAPSSPGGALEPLAAPGARARALTAWLPALRQRGAAQAEALRRLARDAGVADDAPCELATWPELERLRDRGMEIGAHTLTHPFLSLLDPAEQRAEIEGSLDRIESRLGIRPVGLAYPGGDHDAASVTAARDAGLGYAVTTRAGENGAGAPRFTLLRRGLPDGASLGPAGGFSRSLARAELFGAFDRLRGVEAPA